ncbi:MAG: hypothetical protein AAF734_02115 [Bacteroidota bacterium]
MIKINLLFFVGNWLLTTSQVQALDQFWSKITPGIISPVLFENDVKMSLAAMNNANISTLKINKNTYFERVDDANSLDVIHSSDHLCNTPSAKQVNAKVCTCLVDFRQNLTEKIEALTLEIATTFKRK